MSNKVNKMRGKDTKKRCLYNKATITLALTAVNAGMSVSAAANKYEIPRSTLVAKKYNKYARDKPGPTTVLTEDEEKTLVQWLFHASRRGFPLTKVNLLDSVELLFKTLKRSSPFPNNRPGRHWYEGFMRRHKQVSERLVENLTLSRACVTEQTLRCWFHEVETYLKERNLINIEPSRIFNADETGLLLNPKGGPVLVERGTKNVYGVINNNEKESLTVLVTGNAAGQLAPPMVLLPYKRVPSYIDSKLPQGWALGRSEKGWMTSETFFEYVANTFHNWLTNNNIPRPVLLYLDGHVSHLTLPLSQFCSANGIEVIALNPNSTHILQPMDVSLFRPLKCAWSKKVKEYCLQNEQLSLRKEDFCLILKRTFEFINVCGILKNGFQTCGLHPFNVNALDFSKIRNTKTPLELVEATNVQTNCKREDFLTHLEQEISPDTLEEFRMQKSDTWTGRTEDTSLFNMWYRNTSKIVKNLPLELSPQESIDIEAERVFVHCNSPMISVEAIPNRNEVDNLHLDLLPMYFMDEKENVTGNDQHNISVEEELENISNNNIELHNISVGASELIESVNGITASLNEVPNNIDDNNELLQLPASFKNTLFWPKKSFLTKETAKQPKERIPTVITSYEWKKYKCEKEFQKIKKEKEKDLRKQIRLQNQKIKKEKVEEKKREKVKKKKTV